MDKFQRRLRNGAIIILLLLVGMVVYKKLETGDSFGFNPPSIIVDSQCQVDRLLVTSIVSVTVINRASVSLNSVRVNVIGYDKAGQINTEKFTVFERTLEPNGRMFKQITMPGKVKDCSCSVVSFNQ